MIHWGDVGMATGRTLTMPGETDDIPTIMPIEKARTFNSRPFSVDPYSGGDPLGAPGSRKASFGVYGAPRIDFGREQPVNGDEPSTPSLGACSMLGPDAMFVLNQWRECSFSPGRRRWRKLQTIASEKRSVSAHSSDNLRPSNKLYDLVDSAKASAENLSDLGGYVGTRENPRKVTKWTSADALPPELKEYNLRIIENAKVHKTHEFAMVQRLRDAHPVLRRGQHFDIALTFEKDFDLAKHDLKVILETGKLPRESNGTRIVLPASSKMSEAEVQEFNKGVRWGAEITVTRELTTFVRIYVGCAAIVGCWDLKVQISQSRKFKDLVSEAREDFDRSVKIVEFLYPLQQIYILFNPWCQEDSVYMPDAMDRDEYVLNEAGKIWRGSHNSLKPTYWIYGQFEDLVLEASLQVLSRSRLPLPLRSSPVQVARTIAAVVNSPDDNGVVEGNWSGDFRGGVAPTEWTGSVDILRKYCLSSRSVPFGQCWVFAGVATTVLRCLGIPCRPVTCYSAAHDTDSSITIDCHYDLEGRPMRDYNSDSIWNFHCWNECWMKRADLQPEYSGWQVIDATPQEKSDGVYRIGPAPVAAIKKGEIGLSYDAAFVFAEVNADTCHWLHTTKGARFIMKQTDKIGRMISTKKPGRRPLKLNEDREDITDLYKFPEKSFEERKSVLNALFTEGSHSVMAFRDYPVQKEDVQFALHLSDDAIIGDDFKVGVAMKNYSEHPRSVHVSLRIHSALYNSSLVKKLKMEKFVNVLKPGEETLSLLTVTESEYLPRLLDQCCFLVTTMAYVEETSQLFSASDDYRVRVPDIKLTVQGAVEVNTEFTLYAELHNPLSTQLTGCRFALSGPGVVDPEEISVRNVPARGIAHVSVTLKPWKTGEHVIVVHFTSNQLKDVDGAVSINVHSSSS